MKSLISFLALISFAHAVIEPGMCPPKPPTITEFDAEAVRFVEILQLSIEYRDRSLFAQFQYLGDWYAYATVPGFFQPEGVSCQRAQYGTYAPGNISVYNVQIDEAGEADDICGYAINEDPALPGEFCVYFVQGEQVFPGCGLYWILDTDYTSYASVYSCADGDILGVRSVFAWLLTREQVPSQETVSSAKMQFVTPLSNCILCPTD